MTPEEWAKLADRVASLIPRYLYVLQAVAGAVLLIVAYMMGHVHFRLIQRGVRAQGTVVDFKYKDIGSRNVGRSTPDPAFMPIVEFQAGERIVRFQDWLGTASAGRRHSQRARSHWPGVSVSGSDAHAGQVRHS